MSHLLLTNSIFTCNKPKACLNKTIAKFSMGILRVCLGLMWWLGSVVTALPRLRQEDCHDCQVGGAMYRVSSQPRPNIENLSSTKAKTELRTKPRQTST